MSFCCTIDEHTELVKTVSRIHLKSEVCGQRNHVSWNMC